MRTKQIAGTNFLCRTEGIQELSLILFTSLYAYAPKLTDLWFWFLFEFCWFLIKHQLNCKMRWVLLSNKYVWSADAGFHQSNDRIEHILIAVCDMNYVKLLRRVLIGWNCTWCWSVCVFGWCVRKRCYFN